MLARLSGAMVVVLTIVVAFRFVESAPATSSEGQKQVSIGPSILGIQAFKAHPHGSHPGRGNGLIKKSTTTTAPAPISSTTAAPGTTTPPPTSAPVTTAPSTTSPPTSAPPTTATTAPPTTSAPPATTTTAPSGIPAGAVVIQPGSNVQSIVNSKPAGSTFYFVAGLYSGQSIAPRNGDVFLAQPGAVLTGNNQVQFAFRSTASNVTIQGFVVEKYANIAGSGAIDGAGTAWSIIGNEVRYNSGGGITLGDGYHVIGNYVHHNLQIGIKGKGVNVLIADNEIAFNNHLDSYEMSWEAGGTKFVNTSNLVVRGNYVHSNHGHGLWTDGVDGFTLYENNTVLNNFGSGIFHEISVAAVIRYNHVEGNAFPHSSGGIKITNSDGVEVFGNTVRGNDGGIHAGQNDRGGYVLRDLWVHDNEISFSQGWSGVSANSGGDSVYGQNNRFDLNSYWVSSQAEPMFWMGDTRTVAEWKGYGQDAGGSFS